MVTVESKLTVVLPKLLLSVFNSEKPSVFRLPFTTLISVSLWSLFFASKNEPLDWIVLLFKFTLFCELAVWVTIASDWVTILPFVISISPADACIALPCDVADPKFWTTIFPMLFTKTALSCPLIVAVFKFFIVTTPLALFTIPFPVVGWIVDSSPVKFTVPLFVFAIISPVGLCSIALPKILIVELLLEISVLLLLLLMFASLLKFTIPSEAFKIAFPLWLLMVVIPFTVKLAEFDELFIPVPAAEFVISNLPVSKTFPLLRIASEFLVVIMVFPSTLITPALSDWIAAPPLLEFPTAVKFPVTCKVFTNEGVFESIPPM